MCPVQPTGDKLAVRTRLPRPVLKLEHPRPSVSGRTRRLMASLLTPQPQELPSPLSDHCPHEKKSTPATPSAEDKEVTMAIDDVVPSLPNKEVDTRVVTKTMRRKAWLQYAALCWAMFLCGWNDGTTGPLIPRLQEVYHVRGTRGHRLLLRRVADLAATMQVPYSILSIIFIAGCIVRFPSFPRPSCTPLITCTTIPGLHLRCLSLPLPDGQVRLWIGTALHPLHFPWSYLLTTSYHRCPGGLHWYDMSCTILLHSR